MGEVTKEQLKLLAEAAEAAKKVAEEAKGNDKNALKAAAKWVMAVEEYRRVTIEYYNYIDNNVGKEQELKKPEADIKSAYEREDEIKKFLSESLASKSGKEAEEKESETPNEDALLSLFVILNRDLLVNKVGGREEGEPNPELRDILVEARKILFSEENKGDISKDKFLGINQSILDFVKKPSNHLLEGESIEKDQLKQTILDFVNYQISDESKKITDFKQIQNRILENSGVIKSGYESNISSAEVGVVEGIEVDPKVAALLDVIKNSGKSFRSDLEKGDFDKNTTAEKEEAFQILKEYQGDVTDSAFGIGSIHMIRAMAGSLGIKNSHSGDVNYSEFFNNNKGKKPWAVLSSDALKKAVEQTFFEGSGVKRADFIIQIKGNHWVTATVVKDGDDLSVLYQDPFGSGVNPKVQAAFSELGLNVNIATVGEYKDLKNESFRQPSGDGVTCSMRALTLMNNALNQTNEKIKEMVNKPFAEKAILKAVTALSNEDNENNLKLSKEALENEKINAIIDAAGAALNKEKNGLDSAFNVNEFLKTIKTNLSGDEGKLVSEEMKQQIIALVNTQLDGKGGFKEYDEAIAAIDEKGVVKVPVFGSPLAPSFDRKIPEAKQLDLEAILTARINKLNQKITALEGGDEEGKEEEIYQLTEQLLKATDQLLRVQAKKTSAEVDRNLNGVGEQGHKTPPGPEEEKQKAASTTSLSTEHQKTVDKLKARLEKQRIGAEDPSTVTKNAFGKNMKKYGSTYTESFYKTGYNIGWFGAGNHAYGKAYLTVAAGITIAAGIGVFSVSTMGIGPAVGIFVGTVAVLGLGYGAGIDNRIADMFSTSDDKRAAKKIAESLGLSKDKKAVGQIKDAINDPLFNKIFGKTTKYDNKKAQAAIKTEMKSSFNAFLSSNSAILKDIAESKDKDGNVKGMEKALKIAKAYWLENRLEKLEVQFGERTIKEQVGKNIKGTFKEAFKEKHSGFEEYNSEFYNRLRARVWAELMPQGGYAISKDDIYEARKTFGFGGTDTASIGSEAALEVFLENKARHIEAEKFEDIVLAWASQALDGNATGLAQKISFKRGENGEIISYKIAGQPDEVTSGITLERLNRNAKALYPRVAANVGESQEKQSQKEPEAPKTAVGETNKKVEKLEKEAKDLEEEANKLTGEAKNEKEKELKAKKEELEKAQKAAEEKAAEQAKKKEKQIPFPNTDKPVTAKQLKELIKLGGGLGLDEAKSRKLNSLNLNALAHYLNNDENKGKKQEALEALVAKNEKGDFVKSDAELHATVLRKVDSKRWWIQRNNPTSFMFSQAYRKDRKEQYKDIIASMSSGDKGKVKDSHYGVRFIAALVDESNVATRGGIAERKTDELLQAFKQRIAEQQTTGRLKKLDDTSFSNWVFNYNKDQKLIIKCFQEACQDVDLTFGRLFDSVGKDKRSMPSSVLNNTWGLFDYSLGLNHFFKWRADAHYIASRKEDTYFKNAHYCLARGYSALAFVSSVMLVPEYLMVKADRVASPVASGAKWAWGQVGMPSVTLPESRQVGSFFYNSLTSLYNMTPRVFKTNYNGHIKDIATDILNNASSNKNYFQIHKRNMFVSASAEKQDLVEKLKKLTKGEGDARISIDAFKFYLGYQDFNRGRSVALSNNIEIFGDEGKLDIDAVVATVNRDVLFIKESSGYENDGPIAASLCSNLGIGVESDEFNQVKNIFLNKIENEQDVIRFAQAVWTSVPIINDKQRGFKKDVNKAQYIQNIYDKIFEGGKINEAKLAAVQLLGIAGVKLSEKDNLDQIQELAKQITEPNRRSYFPNRKFTKKYADSVQKKFDAIKEWIDILPESVSAEDLVKIAEYVNATKSHKNVSDKVNELYKEFIKQDGVKNPDDKYQEARIKQDIRKALKDQLKGKTFEQAQKDLKTVKLDGLLEKSEVLQGALAREKGFNTNAPEEVVQEQEEVEVAKVKRYKPTPPKEPHPSLEFAQKIAKKLLGIEGEDEYAKLIDQTKLAGYKSNADNMAQCLVSNIIDMLEDDKYDQEKIDSADITPLDNAEGIKQELGMFNGTEEINKLFEEKEVGSGEYVFKSGEISEVIKGLERQETSPPPPTGESKNSPEELKLAFAKAIIGKLTGNNEPLIEAIELDDLSGVRFEKIKEKYPIFECIWEQIKDIDDKSIPKVPESGQEEGSNWKKVLDNINKIKKLSPNDTKETIATKITNKDGDSVNLEDLIKDITEPSVDTKQGMII